MMGQKNAMRFALLGSVSAAALVAGYPAKQAIATETDGTAITSTDATGLQETTAGNTAVLINSNGGAITLGANGANAVTVNGTTANLTLTVDATGGTNAVIFAGDVVTTAAGDQLTINHVDNAITFQDNITETNGTAGAIVINSGSATINGTTTITIDTARDADITVNAAIDGVDAGDTVNIVLSSTDADAVRTTTFTDTIGSNVDSITIGVDETATNKNFQANVSATAITIGGSANVATNTTFQTATDGTSITVSSTINVLNATGTDKILVLDSASTTADTVTFTGTIGNAAVVIDSIDIGSATLGGNAIFTGAIGGGAAPAVILITSGDASAETSSATFSASAVIATAFTLTETIDAAGQATLKFNGTTQAIGGTINASASGGKGTLIVDSTAATFAGAIGGINALRSIQVGSTDGTNSSAEFNAATIATAFTLGNGGSTADTATLIIEAQGSAFAVGGTVDGNATDTATLPIIDTGAGAAADAITMSGNIGATTPLDVINVGTATQAGEGIFSGTVAAAAMNITAGDAAGETAKATVVGAATITTLTQTAGTANANQDASSEFRANLSTTTITLDESNASGGQTEMRFNTTVNGTSNVVTGTIDGGASNEGALLITDGQASATNETVTFSGKIGATNKLRKIDVGTGTGALGGGNAIFSDTVNATAILINATNTNDAGVSTAIFSGDVTGAVSLIGGDNDAEDASATFSKDLTGNISIEENNTTTGDVTVTFNGTTTQTITGNIDATGAGEGDVVISGSDVNIVGTIGQTQKLGTITVSGTAKFASTTSIDAAALNLTGTLHLGDTMKLGDVAASQMDVGAGANAKIVMTSPVATYDGGVIIDAADTASTLDASNVVDITPHASFTSGSIIIVKGGSQTTNALTNGDFNVAATTLATYAVTTSSNVNTITATPKSAAATAAEIGISTQQAEAVGQAAVATAGDATVTLALNTALAAGGSEAIKAAKQVINDAGALSATGSASAGAGSASFSAVGTRLASLRSKSHNVAYSSGDASLGFAAGSGPLADTVWLKPFFGTSDQDLRSDIDGYRSDTKGLAGGWDTNVSDGTKVGVYGSFSVTNVDGRGVADAQSQITTQLIGVYGDYTTNDFYIEGMVAYGRNEVTSDRLIDFSGLSLRAKGEFTSSQYQGKIGAGAPLKAGGMYITPNASISYTKVKGQSFTESQAGTLNLSVDQDDTTVLLGQAGLKIHANVKDDDGVWIPEFRANVMNDFASEEATSTSQFANGLGTAFNVTGADVAELSGSLGVGMMYEVNNVKVGVSYDYVAKADYHGHNGTISARWKF